MRLKEDSNSWKASGIKRRDARNVKAAPEAPKHRASKETRRWCRGKKGVEHVKEWVVDKNRYFYPRIKWWDERCKKCGKKFGWWSGRGPKPEGINDGDT